MKLRVAIVVGILVALAPARALFAHAFDPMLVELREDAAGRVETRVHAPASLQGSAEFHAPSVTITPPDGAGLRGHAIALAGLDEAHEAVLRVTLRDGSELTAVLHGDTDRFFVPAAAAPPRSRARVAADYLRLGIVHLLTGFDHLLFLLALVLLVPAPRRLVAAATAFTVAHSLTLALATFGGLSLPQPPVEALIALSIVFLAVELVDARPDTPTRLRPAATTFAFGLVHGLGFAGALADLGLDRANAALALGAFNVGVELGQLVFVAALFFPLRLVRTRRLPAYAIGSVASAWLLARVAAFFALALAVGLAVSGCHHDPYVETRAACGDHNPLRNVYFGDLHVHTTYSFDAHMFDVRTTPAQAYRFARGEPVALPPLDADGNGTRTVQIDRPLDFAAVTDHSEFLGEVEACTTPGSPAYDSPGVRRLPHRRQHGRHQLRRQARAAIPTAHDPDICGSRRRGVPRAGVGGVGAHPGGGRRRLRPSAACSFTSFVAYEYSRAPGV